MPRNKPYEALSGNCFQTEPSSRGPWELLVNFQLGVALCLHRPVFVSELIVLGRGGASSEHTRREAAESKAPAPTEECGTSRTAVGAGPKGTQFPKAGIFYRPEWKNGRSIDLGRWGTRHLADVRWQHTTIRIRCVLAKRYCGHTGRPPDDLCMLSRGRQRHSAVQIQF